MAKERNKSVPASYMILKKDGKVLLAQRSNTGYYDGWYALPAGHLESGEVPSITAIRETQEEIGVTVLANDLQLAHVMYRTAHNATGDRSDYFFTAEKWLGEITNKEPEKCSDLQWFAINNLPSNTVHYIKDVLENIEKGILYSEVDKERSVANPTK